MAKPTVAGAGYATCDIIFCYNCSGLPLQQQRYINLQNGYLRYGKKIMTIIR